MPFGWKRPSRGRDSRAPEPIYLDLRAMAIAATPAKLGLTPTTELPRVWGVLMEMGLDRGVATLVGFADGATSLYTSSGWGIIGGGEHAHIAALTRRFLEGSRRFPPLIRPCARLPAAEGRAHSVRGADV